MNWVAVREGLRRVRVERRVSLRKLHDVTGVNASTIHRIESIKKYPAHTPDLETIDALVRGLGLTLSGFFLTIEGPAVTNSAGDNHPHATHSRAGDVDSVQAQADRNVIDTHAFVRIGEAIALGIERGIDRLLAARKQDADSGADEAARDADHRRSRG
jgi:transcriptional regulator with XRE-family HTH domain